MPKKKTLTVTRVLSLILSFLTLCVAGGVVSSLLVMPAVFGANKVARAVIPSLQVEGVDFDVTDLPQKSTMYASDGTTKIAEFYEDNRVVVPIKNISKVMQQAVVAREDRRFFEHAGVDVQGVLRAFMQTYILRHDMQGGSSLTQQYVKNMLVMKAERDNDPIAEYHASEDTIARKVREMLIAVQVEKKYDKYEILQGYLNVAQFGSRRLYGVETAAHRYFNTSAKDLNVVQAATIAAITKNPEKFDPSIEANQPEAQKQRDTVLKLMFDQGMISQKDYDSAKATPLKDTLNIQPVATGCQNAGDYGFFCEYVTKRILNSTEFGKTQEARDQLLKEGGLSIVTTLDLDASRLLMDTARQTIPPDDPSGFEIVMASVKPGTGEVLGFGLNRYYDAAKGDSEDPTHTAVNYAVDSIDGGGSGFPTGSSWKPINLLAWMQSGHSINENLRTSTNYRTSEFNCKNYTGKSRQYAGGSDVWHVTNALTNGTVNPESPFLGLVRSHNTTQAAEAAIIGLCPIADMATAVGYHDAETGETIDKTPQYTPAMLLGAVHVSPLTMANVFATYAANGVECTPVAIKKVTRVDGNELRVPQANCHQAVDPGIIQTLAYTLNQGTTRPDGAGVFARLSQGRKTFAKTGTHEDKYMTTGGFVPHEIATFVLVGDAQDPTNHPVANIRINGVYRSYWDGGYIAAPAWKRFNDAYLDQKHINVDASYGTADPKYMGAKSTTTQQQSGHPAAQNTQPQATQPQITQQQPQSQQQQSNGDIEFSNPDE